MTLKTVKVPREIEPLFAHVEPIVSEYFAARISNPAHGTIEIGGERYILVRAASLSIEFFALLRRLFGAGREVEADDFARNMLFDFSHAIGKSDAECFHKKMHLADPIARLSAGPIHFAHSGWAFVDISPESNPSPDKNFYLLYDHPYSFEADAWVRCGRKAAAPVCVMNAGYSSGWCEASFGIPLAAVEILCRAAGDSTCRFIMAPPETLADRVEAYLKCRPHLAARVERGAIPEFFARKRVEEQVFRQNALLSIMNRVLHESLSSRNDEALAQTCLIEAQQLTKSKSGFIGAINAAGRFDVIAGGKPDPAAGDAAENNATAALKDLPIRGLWGKVLRTGQSLIVNDPFGDPEGIETADGHLSSTPFLGVPLHTGEKVTGMVGLAGKKLGYDQTDLEAIESLSGAFAEVLAHKQAAQAKAAGVAPCAAACLPAASVIAADSAAAQLGP
jgi:predicted hydrocarbon binding protein